MNFFNPIPLLRLLFPFIAGILTFTFASGSLPGHFVFIAIFSLLALVILFLTFFTSLSASYKFNWVFGLLLNLNFILAGYLVTHYSTVREKGDYFGPNAPGTRYALIEINEMPVLKKKTVKTEIIVKGIRNESGWTQLSGKAMAYFKRDSLSEKLCYGGRLLVSTSFTEIPPPQNPGEFNYKRFLSFHSVYHRIYLRPDQWKPVSSGHGNPFIRTALFIRGKLLALLKANDLAGNELSVGSALLLGLDDEISPDLIRAYSASGALHVLSVSGLHVGIIFLTIELVLKFLNYLKYGPFIKTVISILLIWAYAMITGFSPSVLRASLMITIVIVGKHFREHTDIFNSISVSAFLLLFINPYLIFEVGFQLSYLAVLGIVIIHPKIYPLWEAPNWLMDKIWSIISISLAAQIATFPLGLLYFHQFPNYFIFSNLLVIPVSSIILFLGIFVLLFSPVHLLSHLIAKFLVLSIKFLNATVLFIEHLPLSITEGISISIMETWLAYFLIFFLFSFFVWKRYRFLLLSGITGSIILFFQAEESFAFSKQKQMIVYNVPGHTVIDFIEGNKNIFCTDSSFAKDKDGLLFFVKHNWWDIGLKENHIVRFEKDSVFKNNFMVKKRNFMNFSGLRITIIDGSDHQWKKMFFPDFDLLILRNNPKIYWKEVPDAIKSKKLIIDSSNNEKYTRMTSEIAGKMGIEVYAVTKEGAFVLSFPFVSASLNEEGIKEVKKRRD